MNTIIRIALLALLCLAITLPAGAQSSSGQPRKTPGRVTPKINNSSSRRPVSSRPKPSSAQPKTGDSRSRSRERPSSTPKPNRATNGSTLVKKDAKDDASKEKKEDSKDEKADDSLLGSVKSFVRENSTYIFGALGLGLVGTFAWMFLSGKKKGRGDYLEKIDDDVGKPRRRSSGGSGFSSAQIRAKDVDRRLGSAVEVSEVETDREYALVVEEEALKIVPDEVDENTGKVYVRDEGIREAIRANDHDRAWAEYTARLEEDIACEFHDELEFSFYEQLVQNKQYDRAARVLEHHVDTHAKQDIKPEIYFNLGYVHVLQKTYNKSRRFLKLYVELEKDAQRAQRAQSILEKLGTS